MTSKWKKAKMALRLNMCLYVPHSDLDEPSSAAAAAADVARRLSNSLSLSSPTAGGRRHLPPAPTSSSSGPLLSGPGRRSSKNTCAICLTSIRPGQGQAIFTAECSHSFHFHCITDNARHGNQICPVCRAKWKEVPLHSSPISPNGKSRVNPISRAHDDGHIIITRRIPQPRLSLGRSNSSLIHRPEPICFDDDEELLNADPESGEQSPSTGHDLPGSSTAALEIKTYPEVPAVAKSASNDNFTVLIHLKAPKANTSGERSQTSRAPVDLVTVLDVSGSMAGTKLALVKRAMGFVIQNLGPADRLSVIAFSSSARRLFPLRRMTDTGREQALQAVNYLSSDGGTNIAEGLRKGFKVMSDRKRKNPVSSLMLLSDGQDTYSTNSGLGSGNRRVLDCRPLLVSRTPVHTFGFGADHDASLMHSISETSGGTFSFIEDEGVIQDAFAQCIGGLLSVVLQELRVDLESKLQIRQIKAGSYQSNLGDDGRSGSILVGDMYAEEERDFLVMVNVPIDQHGGQHALLKVRCVYKDPITKETVRLEEASEVKIERPEKASELPVSIEVDRQRNRLSAAEAMAEARVAAERGDLSAAVSILEVCSETLSGSASARAGDKLSLSLYSELKEMKERMANRRIYEESGRAYVLSGLSSHSLQRATARGDSINSNSLVQAYQTPSMTDMVTLSQTMVFGLPPGSSSSSSRRKQLRHALSFPAGPRAR